MKPAELAIIKTYRDAFWRFAEASGTDPLPPGIEPYNASVDYVGPQNRWIGRLIPRRIYGVDINECAYGHDVRYADAVPQFIIARFPDTPQQARHYADRQFYGEMLLKVDESAIGRVLKFMARRRAWIYYKSVRCFGHRYFGKPSKTAERARRGRRQAQ